MNRPLFKSIPHVGSFWHFVICYICVNVCETPMRDGLTDEQRRQTREARATQPLDAGRLSFAKKNKSLRATPWIQGDQLYRSRSGLCFNNALRLINLFDCCATMLHLHMRPLQSFNNPLVNKELTPPPYP